MPLNASARYPSRQASRSRIGVDDEGVLAEVAAPMLLILRDAVRARHPVVDAVISALLVSEPRHLRARCLSRARLKEPAVHRRAGAPSSRLPFHGAKKVSASPQPA